MTTMMNTNARTMNLNHKNRTIEVTKKLYIASSRFGTKEYSELQQVRRDYPTYTVVVIARKTKSVEFKGLTYNYMEKYIASHDADGSIMEEYKMLTAKSEDAENACAEAVAYTDVKDWFLDKYPEIENFHDKRDEILKKVAERKEAKKSAKVA